MEYFIQQLVNGITLGSIYGLIAIGYTMVYGIIGMINFAHGDIFMIGAFVALISFIIFSSNSWQIVFSWLDLYVDLRPHLDAISSFLLRRRILRLSACETGFDFVYKGRRRLYR